MPRLTIDGRTVDVEPGATILDAARKLGIEIPTLCHLADHDPETSCMACVVRVNGSASLTPSCARAAEEGMAVESEVEEIRAIRRMAFELLLSDHIGDCIAPCHHTCPAHMEIPLMLRKVSEGQMREALCTIKKDIALPAVLGRVCPEVCERTCRRTFYDHPASICMVKRFVADEDFASGDPFVPERAPASGKRVAVVGSGPAGLAAAYYLAQDGHEVVVFDAKDEPGGALRYNVPEEKLPRHVLNAEIEIIRRLGVTFRMNTRLGSDVTLADLRRDFDAVFLGTGELEPGKAYELGLHAPGTRLPANLSTLETAAPGVFAGGDLVRRRKLAVRSIADGKIAAHGISRYLRGLKPEGEAHGCASRMGQVDRETIDLLISGKVSAEDRHAPQAGPSEGFTPAEARVESMRCLHCDCRAKDNCGLRDFSEAYEAAQGRFKGSRRVLVPLQEGSRLIFEPGKCIACGLCVQITCEGGEPLGLTFIGRGFDMRVGVPFDRPLAEGVTTTAEACVEACPTGAIAFADPELLRQPWEPRVAAEDRADA